MPLKYICLITIAFLLGSCKGFVNPFASEKVLAKVDDQELYLSDIEDIFTGGLTPADSMRALEAYVDAWVKKQIKVNEAQKILSGQQLQIEQMVQDYRNSLLNYKLDQYWVDTNVDTTITPKQIQDYYDDHQNDFVLDRIIIKGMVVKFPDSYRQKGKLRDLMSSKNDDDRQDFLDICVKNNFEITEFNSWTDFSDLLSVLPIVKGKNYDYIATEGGIQELADATSKYYIWITAHRMPGDRTPIERIRNDIGHVLLNQRKQEVIHAKEDSIYRIANDDKRVEINIK